MERERNTVATEKSPLASTPPLTVDAATFWRNHPQAKLHQIPTPVWRHRGEVNPPLLATPASADTPGPLDFPGPGPEQAMATYAFEARPGSVVKYVGVAALPGKIPDAYLIYFRHTVKESDFRGKHTLLETGVGDYLIGRMQVCRQVLRSGKNVAVVLPIAMGGVGEFASNAAFVEQCLTDIGRQLFPALTTPPPLLLACNSDGIRPLGDFLANCRTLVGRVKAVYDFDGSFVIAARGTTLANCGNARVFRYNQGPALPAGGGGAGANPRHVPLPYERWSKHFNFVPAWQSGLADPKTSPADRERIRKQVQSYLHHFIPTCMLHHGLASTSGI
jgi:hypothetical protein